MLDLFKVEVENSEEKGKTVTVSYKEIRSHHSSTNGHQVSYLTRSIVGDEYESTAGGFHLSRNGKLLASFPIKKCFIIYPK